MPLPVEDVLAIQKLLADYNHAIDFGDPAGFAAMFVEDGVLDTGQGPTEGRAALQEFAGALPSLVPGLRHLISNVSIDGDGDAAVTTRPVLVTGAPGSGATEVALALGVELAPRSSTLLLDAQMVTELKRDA